jgi:hypothetical protein
MTAIRITDQRIPLTRPCGHPLPFGGEGLDGGLDFCCVVTLNGFIKHCSFEQNKETGMETLSRTEQDVENFRAVFGGGLPRVVAGKLDKLVHELGGEIVANEPGAGNVFETVRTAIKLALIFRPCPRLFDPSTLIDDEQVAKIVDWVWSKMPVKEIDLMIALNPSALPDLINEWGRDVDAGSFLAVGK